MTTKFQISSIRGVRKVGGRWLFSCPMPNHGQGRGDKNQSAEVWIDDNGRPGFKCYGGCNDGELWRHMMNGGVQKEPDMQATPVCLVDYAYLSRWGVGYYNADGDYRFLGKWSNPENWATYEKASEYEDRMRSEKFESYRCLAFGPDNNDEVLSVGCIDWDVKGHNDDDALEGQQAIAKLSRKFDLPIANSRSGGQHLWFTVPPKDISAWRRTSKPSEATRITLPGGTQAEIFAPGHSVMMRVYPQIDITKALPVLSISDIITWAEENFCDVSGFNEQFLNDDGDGLAESTARKYESNRRREMIDFGFNAGLPEWAMFDSPESSDMERLRQFGSNNIMASSSILVRTAKGLWSRLEHRAVGKSTGALAEIIKQCRMEAYSALDDLLKEWGVETMLEYKEQFWRAMRNTDNHWRAMTNNVIALIGNDPKAYGVREISMSEMNRMRNLHPVIPLIEGGAIDLTTDRVIDSEQLGKMLLLDCDWAIPMPNFEVLKSRPKGADMMHWFIEEHMTVEVFDRLAAKLLGNRKDIDIIRIDDANAGKDTMMDALSLTLPGAVSYEAGSKSLSDGGDRYSQATEPLTRYLIYFYNEVDKLGKDIPIGQINSMVSDVLTIEIKRMNPYQATRIGQPILIGASWPPIDTSQQGIDARFQWAYYRPVGSMTPITWETRRDILCEEGIEYLRAWIIQRAREMWESGWDGSTDATVADVQQFLSDQINEDIQALRDTAEETGKDSDYVLAESLIKQADLNLKGRAVAKAIRTAFPNAKPDRKEGGKRAWVGLVLNLEV